MVALFSLSLHVNDQVKSCFGIIYSDNLCPTVIDYWVRRRGLLAFWPGVGTVMVLLSVTRIDMGRILRNIEVTAVPVSSSMPNFRNGKPSSTDRTSKL